MCVIFLVNKPNARPSDEMIEKGWKPNVHGAGVAWREPAKDGKGGLEVVWKKGLMGDKGRDEILRLNKILPTPYVIHLRKATVGGERPSLTHPFLVDHNLPAEGLSGRTKGAVLFHNGDWKEWDGYARDAAIHSGVKIPKGKYSDTRALAWLLSIYGPGFMEFLPEQRGVYFTPDEDTTEVFTGPGWKKINDVWCSNDRFWTNTYGTHTSHNSSSEPYKFKFCRWSSCSSEKVDDNGYCPEHTNGILQVPSNKKVIDLIAETRAENDKKTATGGSQTTTPFPQSGANRLPPRLITMVEAQWLTEQTDRVTGKRLLSKNKSKKIRDFLSDLKFGSDKRKKYARKELEVLSNQLLPLLPHTVGLPH